jgi:hypothetical protein
MDIVWIEPNGSLVLWLVNPSNVAFPQVIFNAGQAPQGLMPVEPWGLGSWLGVRVDGWALSVERWALSVKTQHRTLNTQRETLNPNNSGRFRTEMSETARFYWNFNKIS